MPSIARDFSGKLNLDVHPSRVPTGDYVDAMGITRDAQADGNDLVVSNIRGNRLVSYTFQAGTVNKCIGKYEDNLKNRVIEFIWNDQGYHSILNFDLTTRTRTKILESRTDSGDIDILKFQKLYNINSVNIIHKDDGDLLFFTDGYNRPRAFNMSLITNPAFYPISENFITFAKIPPLNGLNPFYGNDTNSNVNNLKKKLFRFIYRWVYQDGYKSTWSIISKATLPQNAYDVSVETNPQKNNKITLTVTGGPSDYQAIEIAAQESLGDTWSDFYLIDSLDKDDYNIPSGTNYDYIFLNDGQYPFLDPLETELLYDYVPDKAGAQDLVNGNVIVYGDITEGYPAIKRSDVNVVLAASYIDTDGSGGTAGNPTISYLLGSTTSGSPVCTPFGGFPTSRRYIEITIGPTVTVGDVYRVKFHVIPADPDIYIDVSYTAVGGDDKSSVAQALRTLIDNATSNPVLVVTYIAPDKIHVLWNNCEVNSFTVFTDVSVSAVAAAPIYSAGGSSTWKWNAKYRAGLVYRDKWGKTNGVVSFVSSDISDVTDFSVTTGDFLVNPANYRPRINVINASINHLPPSWAVSYEWVWTENQSVSFFIELVTVQVDTDTDYYYFSLEQQNKYKEANTGFVPAYTFQEGDRLRVLASVDEPNARYNTTTFTNDFEILGTVDRTIGSDPGKFLKVRKIPSVTFTNNFYLIEVYRPAIRSSDNTTPFFSKGVSYPIYTAPSDGIRYHSSPIQNQTASQPATFIFADGDVYYKFRPEYRSTSFTNLMLLGVMDANYADFWAFGVNSNGTPFVIDNNAATVNNSVLIRFGEAYQDGTNINGLNRFYPKNYIQVFRDYGAIKRFSIRDKVLHVYQKLRMGYVPIFGQIVKDQSGSEQLVVSDKLLNPIQYYKGQFGIGDHPEVLASNNFADYFGCNIRTTINRFGPNGLEPISIVHEINNFCVTQLGARDFNYKCYGAFDSYNNLYIIALEATDTLAAITLVWNEQRNGFESFMPYHPEMMACLNQLLITWKDGQLYTHDSDTYNNFYGVQYDSWITPVFNDNRLEKKTWQNVTELASDIWECPVITTQANSFHNNNTKQTSLLKKEEFAYLEGEFNSVFRGDANIDINNNTVLKGTYMIARFQSTQSDRLTYLDTVQIEYKDSPKNISK